MHNVYIKKLFFGPAKAIFDVRTLVFFSGVLASIVTHELFHIILHWGEIKSIHVFPNSEVIVEIILTSSLPYNSAIEEALAYGISMITFIMSAMLIEDISQVKMERGEGFTIHQVLTSDEVTDEEKARHQLAHILGIV